MSRHRQRGEYRLLALWLAGGVLVVVIVLRGAPVGEPAPPPTPAPVVVEQCAPWSWTDGAGRVWHGCNRGAP